MFLYCYENSFDLLEPQGSTPLNQPLSEEVLIHKQMLLGDPDFFCEQSGAQATVWGIIHAKVRNYA